ncbi:MAG: SIMPL domain-containing protein [Bacteroidota bacterium]|nr:SIMPL domain-containing protein [Bacteroidota bacterium]
MIKKCFCLLAIACSTTSLFSQTNQEYVEVIASDTISFAPDHFLFSAHLGTEEVIALQQGDSGIATRPAELFRKMLADTRSLIRSMKIDTVAMNVDYVTRNYAYQATIILSFNNVEKLRKFVGEAREIKGLSGFVFNKTSVNTAEYRKKLTEKLLTKARADAEAIALASGKRITGLLSVADDTATAGEAESVVPGWRAIAPRRYFDFTYPGSTDVNILLSRSFRVRYAWK